jgi:hypothetical protein
MTTPGEVVPAPESFGFAAPPPQIDDDAGPVSLFQEINERRARVENTELLQHLRSL